MPQFTVIQGGAENLPDWLAYPHYCDALSPFNREQVVRVRICAEQALTSAAASRRQPAFELWSMVLGLAPPVPYVDHHSNSPISQGLSRLSDAHACFHGLKRPVAASDQGDEMLTYVINPDHYYRFDTHHKFAMVTVARRMPVPKPLVFMVHVRKDVPTSTGNHPVIGALTHWGLAQRSRDDPSLPVDFDTRFNGRHW